MSKYKDALTGFLNQDSYREKKIDDCQIFLRAVSKCVEKNQYRLKNSVLTDLYVEMFAADCILVAKARTYARKFFGGGANCQQLSSKRNFTNLFMELKILIKISQKNRLSPKNFLFRVLFNSHKFL